MLDKRKLRDALPLIIQEIQILNRIDHPHIVKYFETYDSCDYLYLVMEYIQGKDMFEALSDANGKGLPEKKVIVYIDQLFMAISHLHAQGIIHRDIKP